MFPLVVGDLPWVIGAGGTGVDGGGAEQSGHSFRRLLAGQPPSSRSRSPKNWSSRSIDSGHLPMGSGQPLSDGFHHIDGDSVPSLLIELGVGLERQDKVDAVIRPALEPQAFPVA